MWGSFNWYLQKYLFSSYLEERLGAEEGRRWSDSGSSHLPLGGKKKPTPQFTGPVLRKDFNDHLLLFEHIPWGLLLPPLKLPLKQLILFNHIQYSPQRGSGSCNFSTFNVISSEFYPPSDTQCPSDVLVPFRAEGQLLHLLIWLNWGPLQVQGHSY